MDPISFPLKFRAAGRSLLLVLASAALAAFGLWGGLTGRIPLRTGLIDLSGPTGSVLLAGLGAIFGLVAAYAAYALVRTLRTRSAAIALEAEALSLPVPVWSAAPTRIPYRGIRSVQMEKQGQRLVVVHGDPPRRSTVSSDFLTAEELGRLADELRRRVAAAGKA